MEVQIKQLDVLPMVKHYMDELKLYQFFKKYVPNENGAEIEPAQVLCMMVMNIVSAAQPLYRMQDWLANYLDGITEEGIQASKYNDDRLGRTLDASYEADRGSLLTEISHRAIEVHALETARIHNDTTSVTFCGAYEEPEPGAVQLAVGYNKDHRPDCKQVVFGLNITEDGHVPLTFQLYDGNQADVTTHRSNWEALREFLQKDDFIYVADSKLCSLETLGVIHEQGGKFITVMPRNFQEVTQFLQRVREGEALEWQHTHQTAPRRKNQEPTTYRIHEGESCRAGYRLLWIHSSSKALQEANARTQRLLKAEKALEDLAGKINTRNLKTRDQIEHKVAQSIASCRDLLVVEIIEHRETIRTQLGRGRPSTSTAYKEHEQISYSLQWHREEDAITQARRTDGLFPLIDNTELAPVEVLQTYKKQPYLEKRFHTTKSVLEVAPVFLKTPHRIEAMLFLYFIALMLVSLIERNIRGEMKKAQIKSLPIRPSGLPTKAPTWENLQHFFRNIHLAIVRQGEQQLQSAVKGISTLHAKLLRLLKVPLSVYEHLMDRWWLFGF